MQATNLSTLIKHMNNPYKNNRTTVIQRKEHISSNLFQKRPVAQSSENRISIANSEIQREMFFSQEASGSLVAIRATEHFRETAVEVSLFSTTGPCFRGPQFEKLIASFMAF